MNASKKVTLYGILIALAMILSYIETLIPLPVPVPGVKVGLANLVTVVALYLLGVKGAFAITLLRVVLVGFTFGNPFAMLYGLVGSLFSLLCMSLVKMKKKFSTVGVSILGGIAHNIGQILVAAAVVQTAGVLLYLPHLLIAGCISGALIGLLGAIITQRISGVVNKTLCK